MNRPNFLTLLACLGIFLLPSSVLAQKRLPADVDQLLVGLANSWSSNRGDLWCFYRAEDGSWKSTRTEPIPVLFGKGGLAWGRGVIPKNPEGSQKREGDRRTPAGLFEIGMVFGYPTNPPQGTTYPYNNVNRWDAWVDDPENKFYNQHYEAKPGQVPSWFESQRMRLGDYAYRYKIEVRHNSDPAVPGYGSAIFFHVRRGPTRTTHGCTTMTESNLIRVIRWLKKEAKPHYVVLPRAEYAKVQESWQLPTVR